MTYADLYSRFRNENRLYTADPVITPRWFMQNAVDALNQMQDETGYVKRRDSIVIPANGGTLASPVGYSAYEKHIESVYDDSVSVQYQVMEFQQYKNMIATLYPVSNFSRMIPPQPRRKLDTQYTAWCSFFDRQVYVAPSPSSQLTLTVQYQPRLPQFSADEPYWSDWDIANTNDTAFSAQFKSVAIWREYNDYVRAVVAKVSCRYLYGVGTKAALMQAQYCDKEFDETLEKMKLHKPNMSRGVQIQPNDGVW